ncbi:Retrovirus-related Pol polyprotein from transposon TNT 1-94, partial [Trametes pubescens]
MHSDLWGPSRIATIGGRRYYISFTDDKTRFSTLYLLRHKSEAFDSFKAIEAYLERHHNARIRFFNTDRGGEYLSEEFKSYLDAHGIEYKLSVHDTHEEAGVSEQLNRTIMEKVRAMLIDSGLPHFLWGEAALHATWLKNRTATKALDGRTPFEALNGVPPDMRGVPIWGSKVWVHDTSDGKLGERAKCGHWVGFDAQSKGSRIYWPGKRSITVERSIRFTDPGFPLADALDDTAELEGVEESSDNADAPQRKLTQSPELLDDDLPPSEAEALPQVVADLPPAPPAVLPPVVDLLPAPPAALLPAPLAAVPPVIPLPAEEASAPRRSMRARTQAMPSAAPLPTIQELCEAADDQAVEDLLVEEIDGMAMAVQMAEVEGLDPRSLAEAKRRPEWPRWEEAMAEELCALEAHETWRLEKPPPGANIISCRWVFHAKKDASGNVYRYRARLVARGFSQVPGVDFFDTYAPVAKTASIRVALAFAARHDFEVHQVDVKSAYLNGEFEDNEVIWMAVPPGSNLTNDKTLVLRLLRPLYGLKQSARHWHKKLLHVLCEKLRMAQSDVDQAVFYRAEGTDLIVIVVHVDDLTVVTATVALVVEVKAKLREAFDISDKGEIHFILGFAVLRDRSNRRLSLSQTAYIESIVRRFGLEDAKPVSTPMDPHIALTSAQSPSTPAEIGAMRD